MSFEISLDKLKEGMILSEDIYDRNGKLLVIKNTSLTPLIIKNLSTVSYKKNVHIKHFEDNINIKSLIQLESGEKIEISSEQLIPHSLTKERLQIKKEFEEMHDSIKDSFDKLSHNNTSTEIKKELDGIADKIKSKLIVNTDLLSELLDVKAVDEYLFNHSLNVAVISNLIGKWMKLDKTDTDNLIISGLLYDIGKLKINSNILNKPGKLTEEEFYEMKKHPLYSHQMLSKLGYHDNTILKAVTLHHEKEDGSGYPLGISGSKIPFYAKILAVADIFDAMTSNRVYKERVSPFKVLEMFQNQTFGKLDYSIVMTFIKSFLEYYVGSDVVLSNNQTAKIISLNIFEITKPLLITSQGEVVDICKKRDLKILDFFDKEH